MPRLIIRTEPVNSGSGHSIKEAFDICNTNFNELYTTEIPNKINTAVANISATFSGGTVSNATVFQGITTVSNSTPSTSFLTGAFVVAGGAGINGNLYAGGNLYVGGTFSGNVSSVETFDSNIATISTLTVQTANITDSTVGNVSVNSIAVTGSLDGLIGNLTTIGNTSTITGNIQFVDSNISFVNSNILNATRIRGNVIFAGVNPSTDLNTGALIVPGGAAITGNINVGGIAKFIGNVVVSDSYVPTANNSPGIKGQVSFDNNYIYICTSTDTWKRSAIDGSW